MLGLDSCDPSTALALAASGDMPTLASLLPRARRAVARPPFGFYVSALWVSAATGRRADSHGYSCWNAIDPATYEYRQTHPREAKGEPFWMHLARAGHKAAILDVPHSLATPFAGTIITEWGCHDRHSGLDGWPDGIVDEVVGRFGLHPLLGIEPFSDRQFAPDDWVHRTGPIRTAEEDVAVLSDLLDGVAVKNDLSLAMLERDDWDVFVSVFGESHPAGHHLWHRHDLSHPRADPAWVERHGDGVAQVYRRLDDALGEHLSALGPSTTTLVLLSHGMGPHYDATQLLEEILHRIDDVDINGMPGSALSRAGKGVWSALPSSARRAVAPVPAAVGRWVGRRRGFATAWRPLDAAGRASHRFFLEPNNTAYGGVRINLAGREAAGLVQPEDFDSVCARLRNDLLDLVNVDTGGRVVREVHRTDAHYRRSDDDELPDLLVDWDHGAEVATVWSPKVGLLHGPYGQWRTGDHKPNGLLLAVGPGIEPGEADAIEHVDLAPSLCARFGVDMPDVDGQVVPWLAG